MGKLAHWTGAALWWTLVLYWLYLWVMSLFMSLPAHDYER